LFGNVENLAECKNASLKNNANEQGALIAKIHPYKNNRKPNHTWRSCVCACLIWGYVQQIETCCFRLPHHKHANNYLSLQPQCVPPPFTISLQQDFGKVANVYISFHVRLSLMINSAYPNGCEFDLLPTGAAIGDIKFINTEPQPTNMDQMLMISVQTPISFLFEEMGFLVDLYMNCIFEPIFT
jgi:hypothetical protein